MWHKIEYLIQEDITAMQYARPDGQLARGRNGIMCFGFALAM